MSDLPPDAEAALAADWITIWQSELAARSTDRDTRELWEAGLRLWADQLEDAARLLPGAAADDPASGPDAPPGPTADLAASRDDAARLAARVAELERRLAELSPHTP